QVVTNATVDGVLSALFAVLIIIVILDAIRIWVKALSSREPLPMIESPVVLSHIVAPAGLWATAVERMLLAGVGAGVGGPGVGGDGLSADDLPSGGRPR
ncbi:MAG: carbon starvation protein, partial [Actinomycetota bacterium]|nr:carbon starvation protein [Actinomycetota bacterium]